MLKSILGITFLLTISLGIAQVKPSSQGMYALKKCIESYMEIKKFSFEVEYTVYFNHADFNRPDDKKSGKIVRINDNFYQEEIGNIKILNKEHEFYLSSASELISIRSRDNQSLIPADFGLDSLDNHIRSSVKIDDGYQFTLDEGPVEKFDLLLTKDGMLK